MTLGLAAVLHAGGVTDDAWLDRATDWCWRSIETAQQPGGYWLKYACAFLDAVPDEWRARAVITSLTARGDTSAVAPIGGVEGEALRPLDLSPRQAAGHVACSARTRSRLTSTLSSPSSSKTAAGCSTGTPGRLRRAPTGAGT